MLNNTEIDIVFDGEIITNSLISKFSLEKIKIFQNSDSKIDFVGLIMNKDSILMSFPKHFLTENIILDTKMILDILIKSEFKSITGNAENELENIENIPLKSYINICKYYNKYGLFKEQTKKYSINSKGRINWQRTISKSNAFISKNNLIFNQLEVETKENIDTFLSNCMAFTLSEGYKKFGYLLNIGFPFTFSNESFFENYEIIINELHAIKNQYFKNTTINLISDLIKFFQWRNLYKDELFFVTKEFNLIWENVVNDYLNCKFNHVDIFGDLNISENILGKFKKETRYFESKDIRNINNTRQFKAIFDHFLETNNSIFIFDSKYYSSDEISNADYKQIFYYYLVKNSKEYENTEKKIICALIIPTKYDYRKHIHVDRTDIDGLLVNEYYLNMKILLKFWNKIN